MDRLVTLRSSRYGLDIELDPKAEFREIEEQLTLRFRDSARFFKNASMALSFSGRSLDRTEENTILNIIGQNTSIKILCIIEQNDKDEWMYKSAAERAAGVSRRWKGQFYRGSIGKNQILEADSGIILLGDVEPGAVIRSRGSIVVYGKIFGAVHAGVSGNRDAFIIALTMHPSLLTIAGIEARKQIVYQENLNMKGPKTAFLEGNRIYLAPLEEWSAELK